MGRKKPWINESKKLKRPRDNRGNINNTNNNSNNTSDDKFGGEDFVLRTVEAGNFKMEAYYAAQGMHHVSFVYNNNNKKDKTPQLPSSSLSSFQLLHSVQTLEEWSKERLDWRTAMGRVLPVSFRFCSIVPTTVQIAMERQFMQLLHQAREWKPPPPPDEESNNKNNDDIPATQTARATPTMTVEDKDKEEMWQPLLPHETRWHSIPFGSSPFAYQFETLDRGRMRKHPALKPLHEWLIQMTECGHVTRQETVSMIPPIVLLRYAAKMAAVAGATASQEETTTSTTTSTTTTRQDGSINRKNNGGLAILDMCAAPGSKTSQLLEGMASLATLSSSTSSLSNSNSDGGDNGGGGEGLLLHSNSGILVANDVNPQRANMLTRQIKRVLHHYPVAVVTAAPAQYLSLDDAPAAAADDDNDRATMTANDDNDDG